MAIHPDDVVVLCSRVEDGPSGVHGLTKEICCQCLRDVWLSPATRKTVEQSNPDYKILCLACGEKRLRDNGSDDDQLMMPSPAQLKEILKNLSELN